MVFTLEILVTDHAAASESDDSRHQTALPGNTARQHRQKIKAPLVRTDSVSDDKTLMQFPPLPLSSRISAADSRHLPYHSCGSSKPRPHAAHAGVDITGKRRATSSPTQGGGLETRNQAREGRAKGSLGCASGPTHCACRHTESTQKARSVAGGCTLKTDTYLFGGMPSHLPALSLRRAKLQLLALSRGIVGSI